MDKHNIIYVYVLHNAIQILSNFIKHSLVVFDQLLLNPFHIRQWILGSGDITDTNIRVLCRQRQKLSTL